VDFDPNGNRIANYRNGKGRGKANSSLDDGQTQSAIKLLIHLDQAHAFKHEAIHEAAQFALEALLNAQFPIGAFPQVWTGPVSPQPTAKANYPDYDWRTEGRIKEYWNMYTLNDDLAGSVSETLMDAHRIYKEEKYVNALIRFGDFLLVAQMPEPQPAWAQQYNYQMQPIWARKFEPAAISGSESQDVLETLMAIADYTKMDKYREPIPRALAYLQKSQLPDGQMARYYELKTNRPLYMSRQGDNYILTYDDSNLPDHCGWKVPSRLKAISQAYDSPSDPASHTAGTVTGAEIEGIIQSLDDEGRWTSYYSGERLVGQPKFKMKEPYISSAVFSQNVEKLSAYIRSK
jgi:PelA/Pel-15E family pectate lyase